MTRKLSSHSTQVQVYITDRQCVIVHLIHHVRMPPPISDHLRLRPPTLRCHSNAHCISSHNHATPVARLNLDQCLISPDLVPMSRATAYLSFFSICRICLMHFH